jgi:hypothetical protein
MIKTTLQEQPKYNPIYDWSLKHGLLGDTMSRYDVHYLHIDSSNRQINPMMEISNYYTLDNNPITTTELTKTIFIRQPNHPFKVEDKITIDGIAPSTRQYRFDPSSSSVPIQFIVGQSYMKVLYDHGIPEKYADDNKINTLYIAISNFTNVGTTGNASYYGNIVLTFINNVHNFFLVDTTRGITYSSNALYIELPYAYVSSPGTPTSIASYFTISAFYVNGIPMNLINAQYPTDIYHNAYYQIVKEITPDGYYIELDTYAFSSSSIGGKSVRVGQISNFAGGFTEPNSYIIPLERIYKNVVSVRLISSEFPNSEFVIKSGINDKIYWQNYEDGAYTYSLTLPAGRYNSTSLSGVMEKYFYNTPRYYYPPVYQTYTNHNYMQVIIDTETDTTTFKSYKENVMTRPFVNMYYIHTKSVTSSSTETPIDHRFTPVASDP